MNSFIDRLDKFLDSTMRSTFEAFSLLAVRLICGGGLALVHGWAKLNHFSTMVESFPDPLHIGSPSISLMLAIFGELICGAFIALGFFTRLFSIPALFTMGVAIFSIHAHDTYEKKELALLYAVGFLVLLMKGSGALSIDGLMNKGSK
ncbi:MAG: DoxX family protein [Bacteriovoracaceae bacterium]|nr:DoxX family protein [Bacteriovoracaceae bacterium]